MKTKNLKKNLRRKRILNQIYIKHFIQTAGNDNIKIKKDMDKLVKQLESLAT